MVRNDLGPEVLDMKFQLNEALDKRSYGGMLLADLSKALYCISHELLIEKLNANSFSLESLTFIQTYLSNRIWRVKINFSFSGYSNVESGVLQGSISGPLFLNIFLCNFFFDDVNIWYQYRSCNLRRWHFLICLSSWKLKCN